MTSTSRSLAILPIVRSSLSWKRILTCSAQNCAASAPFIGTSTVEEELDAPSPPAVRCLEGDHDACARRDLREEEDFFSGDCEEEEADDFSGEEAEPGKYAAEEDVEACLLRLLEPPLLRLLVSRGAPPAEPGRRFACSRRSLFAPPPPAGDGGHFFVSGPPLAVPPPLVEESDLGDTSGRLPLPASDCDFTTPPELK